MYTEYIAGLQSAPTLVFLHHGLGCVALWRDFPRRLSAATGLPAFPYDRYGHGRSPLPSKPRSADYLREEARVLDGVLRQAGLDDVILIGHSDGGSIALLYAALVHATARAPRGVITEAAHLFIEPATRVGIRAAVDSYGAGMRERMLRYHGEKTDALFWNWAGTWLSPRFDAWNICGDIQQVRCPVLALQGSDDEYGTTEQLKAIAANVRGPVETRLIPDCAHEPHLQAPDATAALMQASISSWL